MSLALTQNLPTATTRTNIADHLEADLAVARPVVGYSVKYAGDGPTRSVIFEFDNVAIATTDATTSGAYGSFALTPTSTLAAQNFAAILFAVESCGATLTVTGTGGVGAAAVVSFSIGTAAETAAGALSSTNAANLVAATTLVTLSSSTGVGRVGVAAGTRPVFNATAGTSQLFLNLGIPDAGSSANGTLTITGRITLNYTPLAN